MLKYRWLFTYYWHLTHDFEFYLIHDPLDEMLETELPFLIKRWSRFFIAQTLLKL